MLSKIGNKIIDHHLVNSLLNVSMGIEIERMRSDQSGNMKLTPHPDGAGSPFTNPWITKDYLESMTEIVTPALNDLDSLHFDYALTRVLRRVLPDGELLWPLSMPAILPKKKDKSLLAIEPPEKQAYFESICERYGITRGAPCGVHINFSIEDAVLECLVNNSDAELADIVTVRNNIYPNIAQGFIKYRWLLTYLFGASPVAQQNYFDKVAGPEKPIRSIRQSHFGFIDSFDVDYSSVDKYVDKILTAFENGEIAGVAEFHGSVRFRGGKELDALKTDGVKYLELRMFDLDPTEDVSIKTTTLRFVRLLIAYFMMTDGDKLSGDIIKQLDEADQKNDRVALESPDEHCEYENEAKALINNLRSFTNQLELGPEYLEVIDMVTDWIDHPTHTISGQLLPQIKDNSLLEYGLKQANRFQSDALAGKYVFNGFKTGDGKLSVSELKQDLFNGIWDAK
ncbi:glutamate--cysteine ligase [Lactobacillus sp. Sy-1]|uniref:glutamate--cysteine ligase n=1 Tax=Lactobacillus sp. Sy-1 TaxID=2109645 RepID=UPI001C5B8930|nr:glutamate--cysteine ligase [Lactobacillus sp. Sy-1]MBW1606265.1 glutamate--cysteine ligase [Lactobacillus sp. Sy-1]